MPAFIDNPAFNLPDADAMLDAPMPKPKPGGLGDDEARVFLAYNLARRRVAEGRDLHAKVVAFEDLICRANVGLCGKVAKMRTDIDLELDDRYGECCIGLIKAMRWFDVSQGVRFSTLATESMQNRMTWQRTFERRRKRIPRALFWHLPWWLVAPEAKTDDIDARVAAVKAAIETLNPRLRHIATERFLRDRTLTSIGAEIGLSRERIRQLAENASDKIRKAIIERN